MSYNLQLVPFEVPNFHSTYKNIPIAFLSKVQRELREARKLAKRLAKEEQRTGVYNPNIPFVYSADGQNGKPGSIRLDKVATINYRFRGPRFGARQTLRKNGNRFSAYFRAKRTTKYTGKWM